VCVVQTFGADVHIYERGSRLLARSDADAAQLVREALEASGVTLHFDCALEQVRPAAQAQGQAQGAPRGVELITDGGQSSRFDTLLVCAGRTPNTEGLGLDVAGVALTARDAGAPSR
jgi:pyruvate/2-oxoglutarate dehydrogenase complex dihydrolipoamide dehydrogenase (E3) component